MDKRLMFEILTLATEDDFYFWELMPQKLKERNLIRSEKDLLDALFELQDQGYILLYEGDAKEIFPLMKRDQVSSITPHDSEHLQCFRATDKGNELYFSNFFADVIKQSEIKGKSG